MSQCDAFLRYLDLNKFSINMDRLPDDLFEFQSRNLQDIIKRAGHNSNRSTTGCIQSYKRHGARLLVPEVDNDSTHSSHSSKSDIPPALPKDIESTSKHYCEALVKCLA